MQQRKKSKIPLSPEKQAEAEKQKADRQAAKEAKAKATSMKRIEVHIRKWLHAMFNEVIDFNWEKIVYCLSINGAVRPSIEIAMPSEEADTDLQQPVEGQEPEPEPEPKPELLGADGYPLSPTPEE